MSGVDVSGRLSGKVAIVVGAGQRPGDTIGNGKAIATLFARAGARVLCVDYDKNRANETAAALIAEGGTAKACAADIRLADDASLIVEDCMSHFGRIDSLVNNVGVGDMGDGLPHKLTEDAFDRVMDINLKGAWRVTKAVMPIMVEQESGSVINISSLASIAGATMMAYEVSKAAMNRMTRSVALSGAASGVRCNAITLGLLDTPMAIRGMAEKLGVSEDILRAERSKKVPMGFMGNGWDTAHAALFLASDEARFITGVILPVDGGNAARVG